MKEKIGNILNTRIKRVTAITACATLVLSLGAVSAFAAGIIPSEFVVRNVNGDINYSADGGSTWSDTAPEGYVQTVNPDGSISVRNENVNAEDSANGGVRWNDNTSDDYGLSVGSDDEATAGASLIKNEGGVVSYSTDNGTTWTQGAPDNYHVEYGEDGGSISWVGDERPEPGDDAFTVKIENGTTYYSTDGGATWSETAPDGFEQTVNPDGSVSVKKN